MGKRFVVAAGLMLVAGAPLVAHHAFSAEFNPNAPVKLQGPIHMKVTKPDGKVEEWAVEGGTPNTLQRRGITRDTVAVGTVILVTGYQAKDGTLRANGRNITFPDGRTLFMGSSGTGAPKDGADATEPPR